MPADEQNMRVIVRVRPQTELSTSIDGNLPKDVNKDLEGSVDATSGQAITIESEESKISVYRERKGQSAFSFSNVLDTSSTQEALYDLCKDSINDVMEGINCSILAYGQTGSGKTYSMLGKGIEEGAMQGLGSTREVSISSQDDDSQSNPQLSSEFIGIVPRCIADMFEWIAKKMQANVDNKSTLDYSITANYLQIYNEKLFDLLQDRQLKHPLQLRDAEKGAYSSVYVQGLSEYRVRSKDEVLNLLLKGLRNRATRATEMNNESSRSHTILQLFVQVHGFDNESGMPVLQRSTFSFVDLAGSEKWRSSLTQAGNSQIDVQKEMTNINTSLHALGNCVSALIEPGRKHIPYRDSLLTRLLRDSLGGENDGGARGKSVLIATIREDASMVDETYSTLQFASRASKIKTIVKPAASDFLQFQSTGNMTLERAKKEITLLREHISNLEGAHLRKIEAANQPNAKILNSAGGKTSTGTDVTSLCDKISAILRTRETEREEAKEKAECTEKFDMLTEVLQQCQNHLTELFRLWTAATIAVDTANASAAAAASSRRPSQHDSSSGFASDSSQSSLSKTRRDIPASLPKPKKKTKKSTLPGATGQTPQKPHASPSKQKHSLDGGIVASKSKRKAVSANAALVEKPSMLSKKAGGRKEKEGISLPMLKSNSAGTYGKHSTSRPAHGQSIPRQQQMKDEIQRQKKLSKKKKPPSEGLTSMKKLSMQKKTNQATHNNRYAADDALDDDLLGIINDESGDDDEDHHGSDGAVWQGGEGSDDDDDDDENDDAIMRRIEMENLKIIQAEDLALEKKIAMEKEKNARLKQHEGTINARKSHSRSKDCSRQSRNNLDESFGNARGNSSEDETAGFKDHSIESILAASRNAVLAANGALGGGATDHSPERKQNSHGGGDGSQFSSGRSPARQSVDEEHGDFKYQQRQRHEQEQHQQYQNHQPSPQYQPQQLQVTAPAPSPHQNDAVVSMAPSYNINTSYSNFTNGMIAMPPSSTDNGSGGFSNKCGKHGLESCVLCTMFNAPGSVKSVQYNGGGSSVAGGGGPSSIQNNNLTRSIHSPIKSSDELGNSSTGGEMSRAVSTVPSPLKAISGFCSIHHVNDCLLCSLTSQRRGFHAPPSGGITSSSPGRQPPNGLNGSHMPNSVTAGSPGIGYTQQNNATPSYMGTYGNTPKTQPTITGSGLNSVGGGPTSNTTAPGMFTASPNNQHNFNGYNNSMSLASKDGMYGFGKNDSAPKLIPHSSSSNNVVASQHVPDSNNKVPTSSGQPGSASSSFRSRYPVKSNPISEENEHDLDGQVSNNASRNSTEFQLVTAAAPNNSLTPSNFNSSKQSAAVNSSVRASDEKRHSSAAEFEALLNSMSSASQQKTEAIPSKYSKLPKGGGIQFEDDTDDVAISQNYRSSRDGDGALSSDGGGGGGGALVRTDHRRGNAMNRNSQSGLYEYDYRSKVEYVEETEVQKSSSKPSADLSHDNYQIVSKPKPKPQLTGAAASAASAYGGDMSKLVSTEGGKKAKKKQMNRKLYEMQKNKNK